MTNGIYPLSLETRILRNSFIYIHILSYPFINSLSDTFDFIIDGSYLWILVIVNARRCLMLKDIDKPRSHVHHRKKTPKYIMATTSLVVISACCYGVLAKCCGKRSSTAVLGIIQIIHAIIKEFPLSLIVCLNAVILGKLCYIFFQRRSLFSENINRSIILMQKFLHQIIFQTFSFVFPGMFVFGIEMIIVHFRAYVWIEPLFLDLYWVVKCLLVIFNPITFGMLQSPMRNFVLSFFNARRLINALSQSKHIENRKIYQNERNVETIPPEVREDNEINVETIPPDAREDNEINVETIPPDVTEDNEITVL